jgi:hypothetical protein
MCHFSYKENYIFLRIPKCGTSSWIKEDDRDLRWDTDPYIKNGNYTYLMAKEAFYHLGKGEFFESCDMFARVREPISRMKSFYCYLREIEKTNPLSKYAIGIPFTDFVRQICEQMTYAYTPCYDFLMNEDGLIDPRIKVERLEDVKGGVWINRTESGKVEVTKAAEEMIREHFKKDYETWY